MSAKLLWTQAMLWPLRLAHAYAVSADEDISPRTQLWNVQPLNYSDPLFGGIPPLHNVSNVKVYDGLTLNRTYTHHPILHARGDHLYLIHSSSIQDEDTNGQEIWFSKSTDGGYTWTPSTPVIPEALLPNQTDEQNTFRHWCDLNIQQRAWQANAIVDMEDGLLYAVGQSLNFYCAGTNVSATTGSGRHASGSVARPLNYDGSIAGDPCWVTQNNWTSYDLYNETIYGTKYGMKFCDKSDLIRQYLTEPQNTPPWSDFQINSNLLGSDNNHSIEEPTPAVWLEGAKVWQRFWRDISAYNATRKLWVQYSTTGLDWFPARLHTYNNTAYETDISDAISKSALTRDADSNTTILVHNPKYNNNGTGPIRQPLTIATARGDGIQPFTGIGVLRTNYTDNIAIDTRGYKAPGFQYPTVITAGDNVIVAYSENKQNIWISVLPKSSLP